MQRRVFYETSSEKVSKMFSSSRSRGDAGKYSGARRRLKFDATSPRLHVGSRARKQKRRDVSNCERVPFRPRVLHRGDALYHDNESEL